MAVKDVDRGYQDLLKRVYGAAAKSLSIDVGILEADADKAYADGMTLLEVAIINHFGTEDGHIPPRPFISGWFDDNEPKLRAQFATLMRSVVAGQRTAEEVLEIIGQQAVGEIQAYISRHGDGAYRENAPSTIARKKSSTPLIATGILRSSVSYRVNQGEGGGGGE